MLKGYCPYCRDMAFVIDGHLSCCGFRVGDGPITEIIQETPAVGKRRKPSGGKIAAILEEQGGKCFYCEREIGSWQPYKGKIVRLKPHCDHQVPYCFGFNNRPENFVVACHVCNFHKSGFVFTSLEDLKDYLQRKVNETS